MDYKINNLFNIIYANFVRGCYGDPKIPTKNEVMAKIQNITTTNYNPITKYNKMDDIDIVNISGTFSDIIDDIKVLFGAVQSESQDVLDQLTNSLKENNGVKRELRTLRASTQDIIDGQIGEDYLKYNFTESFNDTENINTFKSDPLNLEAGEFSIRRDQNHVISLIHYFGTKLEFNIVENYAQIKSYGYIGTTDAQTILDQNDPRQLIYTITTNTPTRLVATIVLQLTPDSRMLEINGVTIDIDSDQSKGSIRLLYKDAYKWQDVKVNSIQNIKGNQVQFTFPNINCSHIKIEFIKDSPDILDSCTYYYIINNIAIYKGISKSNAVAYSKPIIFEGYTNEIPIICNIKASGDAYIPKGCSAKLYVAQDIAISGAFIDSNGSMVSFDSPSAVEFDPTQSGTVYLSDIQNAITTISGVISYEGQDFNWKQIQFAETNKNVPDIIEFNNTQENDPINNSIFIKTSDVCLGDSDYSGVFPYSGWVNISNPDWAAMKPLVAQGIFVSGIDIASKLGIPWSNIQDEYGTLNSAIKYDLDFSGQWIGYGNGYPIGYTLNGHQLCLGDYDNCINGWYRPYSDAVTPNGIDPNYTGIDGFLSSEYESIIPDFYFNNNSFYKIFKFGSNEPIIEESIKLYIYQERPISSDNDYNPCSFTWKYKSSWADNVGIISDVQETGHLTWIDYTLPISGTNLNINEEYVVGTISDLTVHGTNLVLQQTQYNLVQDIDGNLTGIDLTPLDKTESTLDPSGTSFDFKYLYRSKNDYFSTWTAYVIVSKTASSPYIMIPYQSFIQKITIENLDTGNITKYDNQGVEFYIQLDNISGNGYFKIVIYCQSDTNTGFCASGWVPFHDINDTKYIYISPSVKVVQKLKPLVLVNLASLIFDQSIDNSKAALITEANNEKYIVVKLPSKESFPGYYFDSIKKYYIPDYTSNIRNEGHWVRAYASGNYTTGSSGFIILNHDKTPSDFSWNNGNVLSNYINSNKEECNTDISTYGYPININEEDDITYRFKTGKYDPGIPYQSGLVGSADWYSYIGSHQDYQGISGQYEPNKEFYDKDDSTNRGFLFYNTAENLSSYYSISYRLATKIDDTNKRLLYKLELQSDDQGVLVPVIRSLKFSINETI